MTGPSDETPEMGTAPDSAPSVPAQRKPAAKRPATTKRTPVPPAEGKPRAARSRSTTARTEESAGKPAAKRTTSARGTSASTAKAGAGSTKPLRPAAAQQASETVRDRNPKRKTSAVAPEEAPTPEEAPGEADSTVTQVLPAGALADAEPGRLPPRPDDQATEILPSVVSAAGSRLAPGAEPERTAVAPVLRIRGLTKRFGATVAVDGIDLTVQPGSFFGIVGPNGAGKTTTLSMVTGLLRPDAGSVHVHGIDVWHEPERAKRAMGVLPDSVRLFDRLSGAQLLYYSGVLRGLDAATVKQRSADLIAAFGLEDAVGRLVADYSAGMTKKIALACSMIHSPRLLVLDEPFESVDPVSAANVIEILQRYVQAGGTVVLSSHGMDMIQRVCDQVAIVIAGRVLAAGTTDEVRGHQSLEDRFVELAGGRRAVAGLEWLHSFSD